MNLSRSDFFYCYNKHVSDYLTEHGIPFIHIGMEPKSQRLYSLYYINDQLQTVLNQYKISK
ncbi:MULTISPECIES: hypothetical protein [Cytobacillus]|uniref:hypothetical protein n=1 Tax=Cytobacillus TaxID=2675230 RepID=UPI00204072D4|nr:MULTISPECIES: hypothetical protein [Cytobacillus]MCM3394834.1 hypothetical protein [Cytobacillus oceanisediminis]UQX56089.1 hypothetical protein M5V91_10915 [Cytobacillus pseudoceanisediminis]